MANKDFSNIVTSARKKKKDEEKNYTSSGFNDYSSVVDKQILSKSIKLDTFESDLTSLSKTIGNIYNGWQTKETMANTLSSVQSMYDRLGKYQEYQKKYGGADLSDLHSSYKDILDNWEDLSKHYGTYKNAEEYNGAIKASQKKAKEYEEMKTADLGTVSKEITDLEGILKTAKEYESNIKGLRNKTNTWEHRSNGLNTDGGYGNKIKDAETKYNEFLKSIGYASAEDIEKALGEKNRYKNQAEWIQKGIEMSSVGDKTSTSYDKEFESKSKYTPKKKSFISFGDNTAEEIYEFINSDDKQKEKMISYVDSNVDSHLLTVGYEYMSDQEIKTYNYYFNEYGEDKALEYLNTIKEGLANKKASERFERFEGKTAKELVFGVEAGFDQFASGMKNLFNTSDEYIPTNSTQMLSSMVRDDIKYEHGAFGQIGYDLINTTSNMMPSILTSAVIGTANPVVGSYVGAGLMGASASGNAYQEMLNLGYDKGQARTYSALVGLSEAGLQSVMGGIGKLGGVSGKLSKVVSGIDNGLAKFAVRWGGSMLSEGFEEAAQEVLTPIFTNIAAGYDTGAEVDWSEVVYSGLLGALSGGMLEGGSLAVNSYAEHSANKSIGQNIKDNGNVSNVFDIAMNSPETSLAYEAYTKYANKGINAENIKNAQLGNLWQSARTDAENIAHDKKTKNSEVLMAIEDYQKLGDMAKYNPEARANAKIAKETYSDTENIKALVESGLESEEGTESHKIALELKNKLDNGKKVTAEEVNNLIKANDKAIENENAIAIKERASVMEKEDADLFVRLYDGETDVDEYANAYELMKSYAYNPESFTVDYALQNKGVLSTEQAKEIYKATTIQVAAAKKATDELYAQARKGERGIINDSIFNYGEGSVTGKVNWNNLKDDQKLAVVFGKGLYKTLGSNLSFTGKDIRFNGMYTIGKDMTFIDVYAGMDLATMTGKDFIVPTISHELTHEMEYKSPELFKAMSDIVLNALSEKTGLSRNDIIADEIARLDKKHSNVKHTESDAISEIVARACEDLLAESKEARNMFKSLSPSEQKTLVEKIKDLIQKVVDWIDEFLSSQRFKSNSKEAKALREMKETFTAMSMLWDKMLLDVQAYNKAASKSNAAEESATNEDETSDGDIHFCERSDLPSKFNPDGLTLREQLEQAFDESQSKERRYVYVGEFTQSFINKLKEHITIKKLPIVMNYRDAYLSMESKENGKYQGEGINYHNLGVPGLEAALKSFDNPEYVLLSEKEGKIELILEGRDYKKRKLFSIVEVNTNAQHNKEFLPAHIVNSVYGNRGIENRIANAEAEGRIIYNKKEESAQGMPQVQYERDINANSSKNSITNPNSNVKEKFSDRDSTGRELSEGQMEYFKDSTVRDADGTLKVMYRGDSSEFTVFDKKKTSHSNLYGRGFYFTDSKSHAEQYGDAREFYLDIKNPLSPKQNVITKKQMLNFLKAIENDGEDYDLYNYGERATAESVLNSVWGKGDFEMLQDINAGAIGDLVAAVELFNEVNGTSYDGIVLPTETVTFNSEQAKLTSNLNPTKDKDIRFSLRDNVEETKELVAVHNMQVSELERTLDLGGLPMPSIAIIKAKSGHSEYGDVSLVFNKSTIDPNASKLNKVYGGDAWTPTYPKIEYKPNEKVSKKINDKYYELSRKFGNDESRPLYSYVYDLEEQLNRNKGESELINELYEDTRMMQLYLLDSGKDKVETIKKEIRTELTDADVEMNEFFIKELGANVVDEIVWDGNGTPMSYRKNYLDKYETSIREAYKKLLSEVYQFTEEQVQNVLDGTKPANLISFIRDAHKYRENGRVTTKTEDDYEATQNAIKDAAGDGYRDWIDSMFKGIEEKSGIRNNVDFFTNSGNRRSWEALHWENNLENVVRVMKSQDNGVAALFTGQAIWAVSAKDYRSIDEIKADSDRLQRLSEEEYSEIKQGFGSRFQEIAESIMSKTESNPFIAADNAMSCIVEAIRNSKTKSGLLKNLKEYQQLTVTETTVEDIVSLVTDIANMPTEYFEAKPKRAVELNEIATAIIPNSTSEETKARLNDMGIKYLEYESGNEDSRLDALNSLEELKFSDRDSSGNTLTDEQQEFFKDSKVRDNKGRLVPVYHGTTMDFNTFRRGDVGYHFGTKGAARGRVGYGKNVIIKEVYLNITNPLVFDVDFGSWDADYRLTKELYSMGILSKEEAEYVLFTDDKLYNRNTGKANKLLVEVLKSKGYDGIKYQNDFETKKPTTSYIAFSPNQIKLTTNTNPTEADDIRYADREDTTVYDLMGERDRLLKENERFKADVERLNERLKLERKVTHGNFFNENQLGSVAGHLRNIANSNMDKVELMKALKDAYSFIANSEQLAWEDVFARCYNIAEKMLKDSKPVYEVDYYSKGILNDIRNTKIRLSEAQKKEAQARFGKNWNRYFFNRAKITDGGVPIESMWRDWAEQYPGTFDADTNPMDMLETLYDIIGSLQDASETIMKYNEEETARWLASEIYNQYWNVSPVRTTADKYDKQIKLLNFEHRNAMKELRDQRDEKLKEQHKRDKEKYLKLANEIRERKDKEISLAKERGKQRLESFKENAERKAKIQSITATTLSLNDMLVKNSKDKHIPEIMKGPVSKLINAIDFSSKKLLDKGIPTKRDISLKDALKDVSTMMKSSEKSVDGAIELYGAGLDENIEKMLKSVDRITDTVGDNEFILQRMSNEDLKTLDSVLKVVRASVNKLNKFHVTQHNAGVEALGVETTEDVDGAKKIYKDNKKHFDKLKTKVYWNNLNPYYAFKNLGKSAIKVFKAFMDGQDKVAFLAKEIIDFSESVYTEKEYNKWSDTFFDFEIKQPDGKTAKFSMNVPQIMSLYCVAKQEDARKHLLYGNQNGENTGKGKGITLVETDKTIAVRKNILLSEADLNNIIAKLDEVDRGKEVADKLQEFMGTRGAELGNEISMARWGIKSFGIENYFPIKVSDGAVPDKGETPGVQGNPLIALLNMSFTHSRNQFATQSIEIGDVFDVFANHMSSMIQYNAMALPVLDMYKWMNTKVTDENGNEISVKTSVKDTFGDHSWSYFNTFLKDVNGSTKSDTRDNLGVKFFKNAKVAKVASNIRTMLLQFTSYIRAGAVMDNKYLLKALVHTPKIKKSMDHCGIALWKSLGYYETDITRPLTDKIKHTEGIKNKVVEFTLKGAEFADKVTWGYLWNACELEVRETRKDLKVGSEEFNKEVGLRLRDVVYRTQVVDSQLTRSQMMRSKDGWDKVLTMFGSENAMSFSLVTDLFVSYKLDSRRMGKEAAKQKNGKYIRKAITAYVVTNIVTSALATMFDAFRDYDEEDKDEEYITKLFLENFATNTSVINKIPYINLFVSIISGFSASRVETDWMEATTKSIKELYKVITGEGSGEKAFKYMLKALSDGTGISVYNLYRDAMALYKLFE